MGPQACESRQQVLVLGQFHLCFCVGRLGAAGEYVENQARAVQNLHFQFLFEVGHLLRGEFVVENHHTHIVGLQKGGDFFQFAFSHEGAGVGVVQTLCEAAHGDGAGRVGQEFQFVKVFLDARLVLRGRDEAYEHGAFAGLLCYDEFFHIL